MIPIPVRVNEGSFLYIEVGEYVLCLDRVRQYYFTMNENELNQCVVLEPGPYVCTHQRTLLSTADVVMRSDNALEKNSPSLSV